MIDRRTVIGGSAEALVGNATPTSKAGGVDGKVAPSSVMVIDVHSHATILPWREALARMTGQTADTLKMFQTPVPKWTASNAVEEMDKYRVTASVLSIPGVAGLASGASARELCRRINDEMAEAVARYPNRFGAFGAIPLDSMDAALEETAYILDVLKFDGIGIGTNFGGHYLGDPPFDPLLAELDRRKAVLFAHASPSPGFRPDPNAIDPSILEFMFDSTRMLVNLVLSGTKRRFRHVKIISTHAGGTMPYLAGRVSTIEPLLGAGGGRPTMAGEDILADLATFYYDLTASTAPAALDAIRRLVPDTRLLFGSDSPVMPGIEITRALDSLRGYSPLTDDGRRSILCRNALDILPQLASRLVQVQG